MSWTDMEYRLITFQAAHRYDAFANPDKVGLGQCACGEDMYYCDHATHFARALIAEFRIEAIQDAVVATINTLGVTLVGSGFTMIESSPIPDDEVAEIVSRAHGVEKP